MPKHPSKYQLNHLHELWHIFYPVIPGFFSFFGVSGPCTRFHLFPFLWLALLLSWCPAAGLSVCVN